MRIVLVMLCLAGCSHPSGPRWPQRETPATDGGESLAPHTARSIAAVALDEPKPPSSAAPAVTPAVTTVDVAAQPVAVTPSATTPDEPITTEDIVIEVED